MSRSFAAKVEVVEQLGSEILLETRVGTARVTATLEDGRTIDTKLLRAVTDDEMKRIESEIGAERLFDDDGIRTSGCVLEAELKCRLKPEPRPLHRRERAGRCRSRPPQSSRRGQESACS